MAVNVLFVCLGNICRSPTAHGVFQHLVDARNLSTHIHIDSAGTAAWHIGKAPDQRSTETARRRGYDLSSLRARQALAVDFTRFDYILAMDEENLSVLQDMAPEDYAGELQLFLNYGEGGSYREVPDPYYGDGDGFELVLDLIEVASQGLLDHISSRYRL